MPYRYDPPPEPHGAPDFVTSFKSDLPLWYLRIHTAGALLQEVQTFYGALFGDLGVEREIGTLLSHVLRGDLILAGAHAQARRPPAAASSPSLLLSP